jgi:hypothetical protein
VCIACTASARRPSLPSAGILSAHAYPVCPVVARNIYSSLCAAPAPEAVCVSPCVHRRSSCSHIQRLGMLRAVQATEFSFRNPSQALTSLHGARNLLQERCRLAMQAGELHRIPEPLRRCAPAAPCQRHDGHRRLQLQRGPRGPLQHNCGGPPHGGLLVRVQLCCDPHPLRAGHSDAGQGAGSADACSCLWRPWCMGGCLVACAGAFWCP